MNDTALTYEASSAECFTNGHDPVEWALPDGLLRKALCRHCGRTWPLHYTRLLTMPGIAPLEDAAA